MADYSAGKVLLVGALAYGAFFLLPKLWQQPAAPGDGSGGKSLATQVRVWGYEVYS